MSAAKPSSPDGITREEFEKFLQAFTHEIRNQLNGIALEAADLAEQAGPTADSTQIQGHIQACSKFLKAVRDALAPSAAGQPGMTPAELIKKWKEPGFGT